jgi:phosphatidylglycerol:prolipoprotein diacylglycerol transferase
MHPILFKLGPITVYSYGFSIAIAFLIVIFLIKQRAELDGIDFRRLFDLYFYLLVWGILGARILYCLLNIKDYVKNPQEIFMLHHGGLSFYGGLISATTAGTLFLKKKGFLIWKIADIIIPYLALGQSIGRLGCFLNGCCYGKPTFLPFGVYFPGGEVPIHPTQLYESLATLGIFLILGILRERPHQDGRIFTYYLLFYSSARFFLEFLRGDNLPFILGLTIYQVISVVIFFFSLTIWSRFGLDKL